MRLFFVSIFLLSVSICYCQNRTLDSLLTKLKGAANDTSKVWLNLDIGFDYYPISEDSFLIFTERGLTLAKEIDFKPGISEAYTNKGIYHSTKAEFDQAVSFFQKSYSIANEMLDTMMMTVALNNIGIAYKKKGEYFQSLAYLKAAIELEEQIENAGKGQTLNNLGSVYVELGEYGKAIEYFLQSLEIKQSLNDKVGYFSTNSNIGSVYYEMGDFEKAILYYEKALDSDSSFNMMLGLGNLYQGLGLAYYELNDIALALQYFDKSLAHSKMLGDKLEEANAYYYVGKMHLENKEIERGLAFLNIADEIFEEIDNETDAIKVKVLIAESNYELRNFKKARDLGFEALKISKKYSLKKYIGVSHRVIYQSEKALNNLEQALYHLALYKTYNDSLVVELNKKELLKYENRVELKELQNDNFRLVNENKLNQSEIAKNQLLIERQKISIYGVIIVLILISGYAYLLYRYIKNKRGTVRLLRQKNEEIEEKSRILKEQAEELKQSNGEIKRVNELLELEINDRTAKILTQNEKLREYAFSNAHLVRAPLARILGLVELLIDGKISESQRKEFRNNLRSSALELDEVIRKVSEVLSEVELKN